MKLPHLIVMFPGAFILLTISQFSHDFMTLTILRNTAQVPYKMPQNLHLLFFSQLDWGCGFLEKKTTEVQSRTHHII